MKIKLSDYIAEFLVDHNITKLFSLVGGGAMHLNDSFGHCQGLEVIYTHHEQAAAIAAESYARVSNKIAAVCITSGPGATNAITGCLCGYMGSIPMLIISGQVRYSFTVRNSGLNLRTMGDQEYDICRSVSAMTKYCDMIKDPQLIRYYLEKALYLATTGRPGPVWLDIPLDIQSSVIDTNCLSCYNSFEDQGLLPPPVTNEIINNVIEKINSAKRPVLYAGFGIRLSGAHDDFLKLVNKLHIPVVKGKGSVDVITSMNCYYAGISGVTGDRPGNFAVQNSDLFLSIGSRLSFKQTGFNPETWARGAYKIVIDIDNEELKKTHLRIDFPIWADAKDFICKMNDALNVKKINEHREWVGQCNCWKEKYPVVTQKHYEEKDNKANIYAFYNELTKIMNEDDIIVVAPGSARYMGGQVLKIKNGQRFIANPAAGPMGYCLPASVGACIAVDKKPILLVTSEGGFQLNIQELQTIKQNKLPVRIIVINNGGYHSIRMSQNNYFKEHSHVGIGEESADLSFPDISKIAIAYGYKYYKCMNNKDLNVILTDLLNEKSFALCEIFVSTTQVIEPKASSKKLKDGTMVSAPLEDMAPFLSREELAKNMYIPLIEQ